MGEKEKVGEELNDGEEPRSEQKHNTKRRGEEERPLSVHRPQLWALGVVTTDRSVACAPVRMYKQGGGGAY